MNVIQQEALAKALGMNADGLANSLIQQENLNKLGAQTQAQIKAKVEELKAAGKVEEANQLMASIGDDKQAKAALDRISAQDRFNAAIEKLQAMVASLVEGPMEGMLNKLITFIADTDKLKRIFNDIKAIAEVITIIIGVKMVAGLISSIARAATLLGITSATAAASTATNAAVTFGVGTIAVIASIAAVMGALGTYALMKDGMIGPGGETIVSTQRGTYQLDKNDGMIIGTNIGRSSPGSGGRGGTDISPLVVEMQNVKTILNQILAKEGSVYMDSTKVGTSLTVGTYRTQ
jgi:hypothetical protein